MNAKDSCCYEFGSFRLDTTDRILFHDGQEIHLTPKAVETPLVLIENHGHLVEKHELLEKVWADSYVEEANVAKHISILRKVLYKNGLKGPFIETIPTRGYRFVAPLTETGTDPFQEVEPGAGIPPERRGHLESELTIDLTEETPIKGALVAGGIIAIVVVLAIGGWFYLPSLMNGDGSGSTEALLSTETKADALSNNDSPTADFTEVSLSTGFEKVSHGVISPDGKLIVFRRVEKDKQGTLAVRRLADGDTIDLVSDLDTDFTIDAAFSPDSKSIYFNRYRKDNAGVYRVPVTGGPGERLIAGIYSDVAVSRDGNQLAFSRYYPGQKTEVTVFVADKNGKNQKAISTVERPTYNTQRLFSNDGQRLLIWEAEAGGRRSGRWVDIDDKTETEAKELAPLFEQEWHHISNLVLLKDGSGFLFSGVKASGTRQIFYLSIVKGTISQITPDDSRIGRFSVSDDGKTIVGSTGGSGAFNMISYDPVTKESRKIMNENKDFVPWRSFSQMPDGRILFANMTGKRNSDIYSMNQDGGNEIRLTTGSGYKVNPVATADGKYIFFSSTRSGAANIWRMDADGDNPIRLTNYLNKELEGVADIENLNRSIEIANNGKTVFFAQHPKPGERSKLMKISINGGEPVELLPNSPTSNFAPRISSNGKKLAYIGFVFDSRTSQNEFAVYIRPLKGDRVGEIEKKHPFTLSEWGQWRVHWTLDGKALTYNKRKREKEVYNIWKLDLETGKETALTSFKSQSDDVNMLQWSNYGKKVFIVHWLRSGGDIVMIKNRDISKKLY